MKPHLKTILACATMLGSLIASAQTPWQIESYFLSYLQGNHTPFASTRTISPDAIASTEHTVWQSWLKANNLFIEEKLPVLAPLTADKSWRWNLPDTLEPAASMPFYWGIKGDSKPKDGYPFFLYLHGSGPKDHEWANGIKLGQRFNDAPSIYFIPQIPNEGEYYRWWQRAKQFAWDKLLRQVLASSQVDPNKIYMFGISEGGYGSQRLGSFYADYLAGAGPMAGGEPLKNAPAENLRNTAFSLRTGDQDFGFYREQLTRYTKRALDSLQRLHPDGYTHQVELIPGYGHAIDYDPTTPWLRQYTRNPYPKHVTWENFEMDGLYRDGFYNLYVDQRSNPDTSARTLYEMDINGNDINLCVSLVEYTTTETDPRWGIALDFAKYYTRAATGVVTVYLNNQLVDLAKPVTLTVNGNVAYHGLLPPTLENMVNSCARFFDPARIYPAAITVDLSRL